MATSTVLVLLAARASAGVLSFREAVPGMAAIGNVVVTADGRHVYAASARAGPADGPTVFALARDGAGALSIVQAYAEGGAPGPLCGAGPLAAARDGRHVYVAAPCANRLRVLSRDADSGRLTAAGGIDHEAGRADGLANVSAVTLSADGATLYTLDAGGRTLGVFRRDADTGALTFVEGYALRELGGTRFPSGTMAASPDGQNLYVALTRSDDPSLLAFSRDTATGALRLIEVHTQLDGGFTSVTDFRSVAMSSDGRWVYTGFLSHPDRVVPAYRRDPESGTLTLIDAHPTVEPISGRSIAVSPEGSFVYVAGDYRLTVLRRESPTGRLSFAEAHDHAFGTVDGLYLIGDLVGAMGIAVSPDGLDVYTAAGNDGAIGHFRRTCGDGVRQSDEACDDHNGSDGDGCSARCTVEPCFACTGEPSTCVPGDGAACDDGNACTTGETCQAGACTGGTAASEGAACDDGLACTASDRCVAGACRGRDPLACGGCALCDVRFGCVPRLHRSCRAIPRVGARGALEVATDRAALRWRWVAPGTFPLEEFGVPGATDVPYTLCIEQQVAPGGPAHRRRLVAAMEIPAGGSCVDGPCWMFVRGEQRYRDPAGSHDGVTRVRVHRARAGRKSSILVEARGDRLMLVPPPFEPDVAVELTAPTGACWRADYRAYVRENDAAGFTARGGLERPCHGRQCVE